MFVGPRFKNYKDGFRFGQLGYDLVEKRGLTRYQARIWMSMGSTVLPWMKHPASGRELGRAVPKPHPQRRERGLMQRFRLDDVKKFAG